ncbi:MAG: ATP-binding protein [Candidatus Omnitrophica bacterium]|nr:ATP-binding protein [Candidatus Omnitrophota bacterium]
MTGPRRAGKTTLLKKLFPKASYYLLEDPDIVARVRTDPRSFLEEIRLPVILDEIQNVPELFNYVRARIDNAPQKFGQWFLTGSQEAGLMKGVTESMAGRVAVFELLPFSIGETSGVSIFRGGFPEVLARPRAGDIWFRSYLQTYLERDVRAVSSIKSVTTFRRFLSLLASQCGQILNKTDLAAPLGVSVPTLSEWIHILETTGQIILVPPFYENFGKRIIKSPKLYFVDSGLACHLLNISSEKMLFSSPFLGAVFEGFIAAEIIKFQINTGKRKELYYFRDQQGLEVDFLIPQGDRRLILLEAEATRTLRPQMAEPLKRLAHNIARYEVEQWVVCPDSQKGEPLRALSPGTKALSVKGLLSALKGQLSGTPGAVKGRTANSTGAGGI